MNDHLPLSQSTTFPPRYTPSDKETVSHCLQTAWEYISAGTRGMIGEVENSSTSGSPNKNQPNLQPCQHVNTELPAKCQELIAPLPVPLETCKDDTSVTGGKRLGWLQIVGEVIYPSLGGNVTIVMCLYVNCMNEIVFLISTVLS